MTEPGMEAVLADLMAEHVNEDQATTGKGDPLAHVCDPDCPTGIPMPRRVPAVPLKPRDPLWFLTGSNWPKPCKRCGSREHGDCYGGIDG